MEKIISLNREELGNRQHMGGYITEFTSTYDFLVSKIGTPRLGSSDDSKVQQEWAVEYKGEVFSIYDWKEYRRDVRKGVVDWHVGGKGRGDLAAEMINELLK